MDATWVGSGNKSRGDKSSLGLTYFRKQMSSDSESWHIVHSLFSLEALATGAREISRSLNIIGRRAVKLAGGARQRRIGFAAGLSFVVLANVEDS